MVAPDSRNLTQVRQTRPLISNRRGGGARLQINMAANRFLMKVELHISCKDLANKDTFSKSDPIVVVNLLEKSKKWREVDRTEHIKNNLNPEFTKAIYLDYRFELVQKIRFDVYDVDNATQTLEDDDFFGSTETTLGQLVSAGVFTESIKNNKDAEAGSITIHAEEVVQSRKHVTIQFAGSGLDKKDTFGKSDPYLEFHRAGADGTFSLVHKSEVIKNTLNPVWQPFTISASSLGRGEDNCVIKVICYDWDKDGSHDLIGEFTTTLGELLSEKLTSWDLINHDKVGKKKYTNSGTISISSVTVFDKYSFLDYILGGCQINFTVGVDFTGSNGDPRHPKSLHYINPNKPNEYMRALTAVGEVCQDYDTDKLFPALGFGAKIGGKVSHEFALNGNPTNPYCAGIQGVITAYQQAISAIELYGPTNVAPVINHVANFAEQASRDPRGQQQYFVLLLLTDGVITDMREAKLAIIRASALPMSLIIIGVGAADFTAMNELDSDDKKLTVGTQVAVRDIVQFVPFRKYQGDDAAYDLAQEVLAEVPHQLVEYMKSKGIVPIFKN